MVTDGKLSGRKLSSHVDGTDGFRDLLATCIAFATMSMENACGTGFRCLPPKNLVKCLQLELLKTDCCATWTMPEQKAFLEQYYSPFLQVQLQATVSQFWIPLYAEWFKKWPEVNEIFKGQTVPVTLSEEQNIALEKAVDARHKKICTWFNNRSQKSGKAAVNAMTKSITKLMRSKAKDSVQEVAKKKIEAGALVTKEEKLHGMKKLTRKAYEASSDEVHALCKAKVQEERDSKAQVIFEGLRGEGSGCPTNEQALEECTGPISQFIKAVQDMTGFEWTIIDAGPDPRLGGQNWQEHTPDFIKCHLNPYLEFVGTIFPEHVRKTHVLDYVPQSPLRDIATAPHLTAAVILPTTDFSATIKLTDWYTNFVMESRSLEPAGIISPVLLNTPFLNELSHHRFLDLQLRHFWAKLYFSKLSPSSTHILQHDTAQFRARSKHTHPVPHPGDTPVAPSEPTPADTKGTAPTTTVPSPMQLTPAAPASIDKHLERRPAPVLTTDSDMSSADAMSAPSMRLPAQTQAATTTVSKRAAAPMVTMDKHLPSPVDVPRKTGCIRQATTHLTQANNIGDNGESKMKRKAPIAGGSLSSSKRQKS
ncbi:hypothetical protein EV424DRAFT_1349349 [Suillus variegatus]|nr:hypothetical protein EV424DRAFT_1349349 [Suillus variegatus]